MPDPANNPNRDEAPLTEREAEIERLLDLSAGGREGSAVEDAVTMARQQQDAIDASLRRQFVAPPVPAELLSRLEGSASSDVSVAPSKPTARRTLPNWAVAAILLMGVGAWLFQARQLFLPDDSSYEQLGVVAIYQAEVKRGFEPDWFCEDEKRFADTFAERQGQGLWLRPLPEGIRMAGLAYLKGLTADATSVMAWVNDKPVLVVVEKTNKVPGRLLRTEKESGVNVFAQPIGDLTAIEITPFDEPRVAPALYLREPPAEPTGRVPGT